MTADQDPRSEVVVGVDTHADQQTAAPSTASAGSSGPQAGNQIKDLVLTAPGPVRAKLRDKTTPNGSGRC